MEVLVRLLAPGLRVDARDGHSVGFRTVAFEDPAGRSVDGLEVKARATVRWRSRRTAGDRAGVLALGILDLVLRWPTSSTDVTVWLNGQQVRSGQDITNWQAYEWVSVLSWGALPNATASITPDAVGRFETLWAAAVTSSGRTDELLGPLALASSAASASHPYDRVQSLWSALELLYPRGGDLKRIDLITMGSPSFADDEGGRSPDLCGRLLRYRARMASDPWLYEKVRSALSRKPLTRLDRVRSATVVCYAVRCKIVHGEWARSRNGHRTEARAAEQWLWQLLEREVEVRLMGARLNPIVAMGRASFTV